MRAFKRTVDDRWQRIRSCPRLSFHVANPDHPRESYAIIRAFAQLPERKVFVGQIELSQHGRVEGIEVDPRVQRCGIGTALYSQAARYSCNVLGGKMQSDSILSAPARGFWEKQAAKGRASCVEKRSSGVCNRYMMSCPVPESLAGGRRR